MRYLAPIAAIAGLTLLTALTAYYGFASVLQALISSQWGTALVIVARAAALAIAGAGWWLLLTPLPAGAYVFVGLRFVRDAINTLIPFATVGGDIIGARLLAQFGVATNLAVASVLIDVFIQFVCLLIFVTAGVGIVLDLAGVHRLGAMTFVMLAVALPAAAGFFLALNFGAFEPVVRWLVAFGEKRKWPVFNHVADVGGRLQKIWRNHRGLSASFVVHLAAVFLGSIEVWIALFCMGHPVSLTQALAIESLGQGSRAAVFILPGGLGVQDGALIAACAIFGVPAEVALAMALIKRVPDLVLGIPALVAWQALESRRLLSAGKKGTVSSFE
ncbi:MAG: lysylphosphatidylglycerol synthase domain-containing protein [Xanthobacteraceae bacterium]